MLFAHRAFIVLGVVATVVTCSQAGLRGLNDYRGARLDRVAELPEVAAFGGTSAFPAAAMATGGDPFAGACAQTLRIATDGRELRLMQSKVTTAAENKDGTASTRLVSAIGEYAVVSPEFRKGGRSPRLRVDCVKGRATGWVGE